VEVYCKVDAVAITAYAKTTAISACAIFTCGAVSTVIAIVGPPLLLLRRHYLCATIYCGDYKRKSSMLHIFILFCL
jgi:hypothetical protein